jgi:hypothetical protein
MSPPFAASTLPATRRQGLGKDGRIFPVYARDAETAAASRTLRSFAPTLKRLQASGGIGKSEASRWWTEGGSPLHDLHRMIRIAVEGGWGHAGALVASVRIAARVAYMTLDPAVLVSRFHRLQAQETEAQGKADVAQVTYSQTGDLEGLENALRDHASVLEDLASVVHICRVLEIDPRQEGRA